MSLPKFRIDRRNEKTGEIVSEELQAVSAEHAADILADLAAEHEDMRVGPIAGIFEFHADSSSWIAVDNTYEHGKAFGKPFIVEVTFPDGSAPVVVKTKAHRHENAIEMVVRDAAKAHRLSILDLKSARVWAGHGDAPDAAHPVLESVEADEPAPAP